MKTVISSCERIIQPYACIFCCTYTDEDTNERFLVDFEKKVVDKIHAEKEKTLKASTSEEMLDVVVTVPTREEMMKETSKDDDVVNDRDIPPPANADEEWYSHSCNHSF